MSEGDLDDLVLRVEPGKRWNSNDGKVSQPEGDKGDRHGGAQPAIAAHVGFLVHTVHDRARTEEQPGLEEAVCEQVHDRHGVPGGAEPGSQHHVADLRHGARGQGLLDVVLGAADDRSEKHGNGAHDHHRDLCVRCAFEDRPGPGDQVDTCGDHGGGVDERGHRGGAFHRIAKPGLQRHLSRFSARRQQQRQSNCGVTTLARRTGRPEYLGKTDRAERREHQHHGQGQAHITDAVDDEGLLGGNGGRWLLIPEADQQVGRQTDTFPPDIQTQEVIGEYQQQHGRQEEIQVAEKPSPVGIMLHVPDRVDMDE